MQTPAALREVAEQVKSNIKSGVIILGSPVDKKVLLIAVVTEDLIGTYHAGNIVKHIAAVVGGSGGGRPDMAQAGGCQSEKLDQALKRVADLI